MPDFIKQIKAVAPVVKQILSDYPATRDNDHLLCLKFWAKQNPKLRESDSSFWDFAEDFKNGKYKSIKSITRSRRILQAQHPELRGKNYKGKQKMAKDTRQNIHTVRT